MRSTLAAAMLASCVGAVAVVNAAEAAEVAVSSLGPGNFVLTALIPMFEGATANKVAITYETGAAILAKIRSGAALDLAILPPQAIDDLAKEGKIAPERLFLSGAKANEDPAKAGKGPRVFLQLQ